VTSELPPARSNLFAVPLGFSAPPETGPPSDPTPDHFSPDRPGPDAPPRPLVALLPAQRQLREPSAGIRGDVQALLAAGKTGSGFAGTVQAVASLNAPPVIEAPPATAPPVLAAGVVVTLTTTTGGRAVVGAMEPAIIGRLPDLALAVADPAISRQHCSVAVVDGLVLATDLGSTNGTWINRAGTRIEVPAGAATLLGHDDWLFSEDVPLVHIAIIEGRP
jgi:FHA domain